MGNTPNIRFKGFTDEWEQRKLGDNIVEYTEKTTINNQYPVLTSSRRGIFFQTDYYDGNQIASADNTGYNIVPYGYFTYRHMSDDEIFHFNINDITENGIVSTLYPVFTTDENLDSRYLQYQLNYGKEFAKYAVLQKQGGSRTYMYLNKLKELRLTIPNFVEEQKKISAYFMKLDNLITLHQREYDNMTALKKYMLQKMFPAQGNKIPEIRFEGFTDPWEQRKLGELVEFYNGDRSSRYPNDSDMVPEGIPFINAGDLVSGRVKLETANKITEEKFNELSGAKIQRGDIIYCLRGTLGKNAFVDNFDIGTVASSLVDIRPKKIVGKYLFQVLNSDIEYRQRTVNDEGAAQPNLSAKNLALFDIPIPNEIEQEKIAVYFDRLDHRITLHQCKCDELVELKKYMLQNMFPKKEG